MAYKLQHWLVRIEYLPGAENTMADALSKEERCTNNTAEEAEPTPDKEHQPQQDGETEVEEDASIPGRLSCTGGCGGNASTKNMGTV